jgi:hypothetical protein
MTNEGTFSYNNGRPIETLNNMLPMEYKEIRQKIDIQKSKDSCAYEFCKAKTSAFQAALHTGCGLSEINHKMKYATIKNKKIILAV